MTSSIPNIPHNIAWGYPVWSGSNLTHDWICTVSVLCQNTLSLMTPCNCLVKALVPVWYPLTHLSHWGRVTHICVSKLTINDSDNGLSPGRRQAIIWTNVGILLIGSLGTNLNEILNLNSYIFIQENPFENVVWKIAAKSSRPRWVTVKTLSR